MKSREVVLERIRFYREVGATPSEIADETLLALRDILVVIEMLSAEGLIRRNGRLRRFGKKSAEHAAVWVGVKKREEAS